MKPIASKRLRSAIKYVLPLAVIPAVVLLGAAVFREKYYALISLAVVVLSQLVFFAGFETRTVGTRRLVITAVMTALSVAGRAVFAPIPAFKPVTAIVIITAVWIGCETGFLVGSLSALISDFFFGLGPWTPFQMLSWGLIGFLAGLLSKPLKKSRFALALYGVLAGAAYSLLMDIWTVTWSSGEPNIRLYLAAIVAALPHTLSYAVSNVIFLLLLGRPFGEKLERVKLKYRI